MKIFKVLDCLVHVAGEEWVLWVYLTLWYSMMTSLWMGSWEDFLVSRASAFTVAVHSALMLAKCEHHVYDRFLNNAKLSASDIYPSFFSLLPLSLFSLMDRWCQLTVDVLSGLQWMAVLEGAGWKSPSGVISGDTGVAVLGMQQAAPQRLQPQPSQMQEQFSRMKLLSDPAAPEAQRCAMDPPNPPLYIGCRCDWGFPTRGQFYHACIFIGCWFHLREFLLKTNRNSGESHAQHLIISSATKGLCEW